MKLEQKAFREVTEKAGFDINAGQNIDMSKSLKETIDYVVKYIDEGKKGCCFHASVYLMKLLHDSQIDSEIILTVEPTKLEMVRLEMIYVLQYWLIMVVNVLL